MTVAKILVATGVLVVLFGITRRCLALVGQFKPLGVADPVAISAGIAYLSWVLVLLIPS